MSQRSFVTCALLFLFWVALAAQQSQTSSGAQQSQTPRPSPTPAASTPDQDVVRITTNLVQVDVVVTKDGKPVTDLKPEDFEIFEDGRRQTITNFTYVSTSGVRRTSSSGSLTATRPPQASVPEGPAPPKPITAEQVGRTMAIVVDDLGMSFESMARVRKQLMSFVSEKLGPTDLVAILRTGGDIGAVQQFTTDRNVLQNAVAQLKWNPCSRVGLVVLPAVRMTGSPNRSVCVMDAGPNDTIESLRFILRGMAQLPGRKSMMLISDSVPIEHQQLSLADPNLPRAGNATPIETNLPISDLDGLSRLAEIAVRSSVVIYSVASQGLQTVGPHAADEVSHPPLGTRTTPDQDPTARLVLDRSKTLRLNTEGADLIARQTGGFLIKNTNEFGFEKVLEDQAGYYLIGYRPDAGTFDRRFHEIKARVKRGGMNVRTRAGFYGVTKSDTQPPPSTLSERMGVALASPFGASEIDIRLTPLFVDDPGRGPMLRLFVALDANDLTFIEEPDKTNVAHLVFSTVFFGDNGAVVKQHDHNATFRLRGEAFERAKQERVFYSFDVPAKDAGKFQFRIVVADSASSRIGSTGQFLTIPDLKNGHLALSGIRVEPPAVVTDEDLFKAASLRRIRQGTPLQFRYIIYNATADAIRSSRLKSQVIIFSDGRRGHPSEPEAVNTGHQGDLKRISVVTQIHDFPPGEYVLQIVVEDQSAKRTATQWIQFEVIK